MRAGDHGLRQLVDPCAFGARELLSDDGRDLVAGKTVYSVVQPAPLSFSHFCGLLFVTDASVGNYVALWDGLAKSGLTVAVGFCHQRRSLCFGVSALAWTAVFNLEVCGLGCSGILLRWAEFD
jgi:hypothetical protein